MGIGCLPPSSPLPSVREHRVTKETRNALFPTVWSNTLCVIRCARGVRAVQVFPPTDGGWSVTDGGWTVIDGGWRVTDGGWRVTDGVWRVTDGGWKMTNDGWTVTDGGWTVTDGGWTVTDGGWRVTDGGRRVTDEVRWSRNSEGAWMHPVPSGKQHPICKGGRFSISLSPPTRRCGSQ